MIKKKKSIYFYIKLSLFIILGIFIFIFLFNYQNLYKEYSLNVNEYNELLKSHNLLLENHDDLTSNYDLLNLKLENLTNDYNSLEKKLLESSNQNTDLENENSILLEDYETIKNDLFNFKEVIKDLMDWFQQNSTINNIENINSTKSRLTNSCVYCENKYCYIKTTCIEYINERYLKLEYIPDLKTSGKEDNLQNLNHIVNDSVGGDCEDFSLLFTAQLRYLIDYVITEKNKIPIIEGVILSDTTKNYFIYGDWYYDKGVEEYKLEEGYIHPYVACGNLYDPQSGEYNGHCVVMITDKEIKTPDDVHLSLFSSYLIEPQFGDLLEEDDFENLYMVIIENDLFMKESILFDTPIINEFKWYGYQTYLNKIKVFED